MTDQPSNDREARVERVLAEYLQRMDAGDRSTRADLLAAHPDLAAELRAHFDDDDWMAKMVGASAVGASAVGASAPPTRPADDLLPLGSSIGQYRLEAVIGSGGMGTIYRAVHAHLGRAVAIKVLASRLARDPDLVRRFQQEARALCKLDHPHIVRVLDMGTQDGRHYFVMDYVDGVDLRRVIETSKLEPAQALVMVPKICAALEYAHERGVVHRDIKPENILVGTDGEPRIADFGLARVLHGDSLVGALTRTDVVMGTFDYMAPEQKTSAAVDHRADIFALGVVLYEMLTGALPLGNFAMPSVKSGVDARIDQVVLRAMAAEPDERYQRVSEMGRAVSDVVDNQPSTAAATLADVTVDRDWVVVDQQSGAALGTGRAARLRVRVEDDHELKLRSWERPEIGVAMEDTVSGCDVRVVSGSGDDADSVLVLAVEKAEAMVFVPRGSSVEVHAAKAPVTLAGLRGAARVQAGLEDVTVRDHQGPLSVERLSDGGIDVRGLASDDFLLRTEEGTVSVMGLACRGNGRIVSELGAVTVGVRTARSAFRYEIESVNGSVQAGIGDAEEVGRRDARGVLANGTGLLRVRTGDGRVKLMPHDQLSHEIVTAGLAGELIFWGLLATGAFLIGWWWVGMAIVFFAGLHLVSRLSDESAAGEGEA